MGTILHLLLAISATLVQTGPGLAASPAPPVDETTVRAPAPPDGYRDRCGTEPAEHTEPAAAASRSEQTGGPDSTASPPSSIGPPGPVEQLTGWVDQRYALAGLSPPRYTVERHDTRDGCRGRVALFIGTEPVAEIHLCFDHDAPPLVRQRTTLHEVAHAWTHQHLTDADRARFLELRGLEHWDEPARWDRQGAEHAAELIAWGLLDVEKRVLKVTPNDRDSLIEGFRFLTGVDPICRPESDTRPPVHAPTGAT